MTSRNKTMIWFGAVMTIAYLAFGALEVLASLGTGGEWSEALFLQDSLMDGFVLLVIGAVFAFGWDGERQEKGEGDAFVLVGIAMGIIFLCIYVILMGASLLGLAIFGSEHMEGWVLVDSVRPGIYLGLVTLIGAYMWRDRLSLSRLSRAGV